MCKFIKLSQFVEDGYNQTTLEEVYVNAENIDFLKEGEGYSYAYTIIGLSSTQLNVKETIEEIIKLTNRKTKQTKEFSEDNFKNQENKMAKSLFK